MTKAIEIKCRRAPVKLSSLLFFLFILVFNAELGLAQDRTLQLKKPDQDAYRFRVEPTGTTYSSGIYNGLCRPEDGRWRFLDPYIVQFIRKVCFILEVLKS